MERDFMGLNSKDSVIVVKEEAVESCNESVFSKASAIQWPSAGKISALPHFMSFKPQDEKAGRNVSDSVASSGFMATPTADGFDATQKLQSNDGQNLHSVHPVSNQAMSASMSNHPFFKTHFGGAGQNFTGAIIKQHLLGGIPVTAPHSFHPSIGAGAGSTEQWNNTKTSGAPAQLTIFYAGTVNVYDEISPEKAQAIMFLAGNGSSVASSLTQQRAQVPAPNAKLGVGDGAFVNQPINTLPGSGLSSPMSVSSHPVSQSGGGSANNGEGVTAKTSGVATAPVTKVDPPRVVTSLGPVTATTMLPAAVPQARKASLARFLEKRKERVMSSAPYNSRKSPECATQGSSGVSFSASSGMAAGPIATGKGE